MEMASGIDNNHCFLSNLSIFYQQKAKEKDTDTENVWTIVFYRSCLQRIMSWHFEAAAGKSRTKFQLGQFGQCEGLPKSDTFVVSAVKTIWIINTGLPVPQRRDINRVAEGYEASSKGYKGLSSSHATLLLSDLPQKSSQYLNIIRL